MEGVVKSGFRILVFIGLMYVCGCFTWAGKAWTHDDAFTEEGLLKSEASQLKQTFVTSHLEIPISDEQNILWCGTFQLAWNELHSLVGEDFHLSDEPAMVEVLNKMSFTSRDINSGSYVAVAGTIKDGIFGQIQQQLYDTFQGKATPRYLPPKELTPRPQDIVTYSYLFKNLGFKVPFERISKPILFGTSKIPCFGVGEEYKRKHYDILEQVDILDYQSENDFVIELKTKEKNERLILSKMQPEVTLHETIKIILSRIADIDPVNPEIGDVLKIPKLNFDVTRRFSELEHKKILTANPKIAGDLMVLSAVQNIRFQLDEEGVRLRSESHISIGCSGPPPEPLEKRIMVFDKPFLIMLQRRNASLPYFALWVENPELLVKVKE